MSARDQEGGTALMKAARGGHADCAQTLLRVSDANAIDDDGWTALMHGVMDGHCELVELLAPHVDARALTNDGRSAFSLAVHRGHYDVADVLALLSHPVEVDREFARVGRAGQEKMPRCAAVVESRELAASVGLCPSLRPAPQAPTVASVAKTVRRGLRI